MVEKSGTGVILTLWGSQAETFKDHSNPVIMATTGCVSEFNRQNQLSVWPDSSMSHPINSAGKLLREWFDNGGPQSLINLNVNTLAERSRWMTFIEVTNRNSKNDNRPII